MLSCFFNTGFPPSSFGVPFLLSDFLSVSFSLFFLIFLSYSVCFLSCMPDCFPFSSLILSIIWKMTDNDRKEERKTTAEGIKAWSNFQRRLFFSGTNNWMKSSNKNRNKQTKKTKLLMADYSLVNGVYLKIVVDDVVGLCDSLLKSIKSISRGKKK